MNENLGKIENLPEENVENINRTWIYIKENTIIKKF